MSRATGGYLITKTPLVRTSGTAHTTALERPVSPVDLQALNAIQATPWRINGWLLDVLSVAWDQRLPIAGLAVETPAALPPKMADDVWAALEDVDRKAHAAQRREVHAARASTMGRQQALLDRLMVANEMRDREAIWFPHARDFRGRMYPLSVTGPHPQGDDVAKSLIMFAEGVPLGADGEYWLCVRAANCFGADKLPLEERVGWAYANYDAIMLAASDPLGAEALTFWSTCEEPWGFLATCRELALAWQDEHPSMFISHLPVPMDGSCNGLQHLSAMGLDPVGAVATNLAPGARQDVYEEVAKRVREIVERDAAAGNRAALFWLGNVTRKVVKRAVMTTPYGVTDGGIRAQLINDRLVPADGDQRGPAADYMRDALVVALGATVSSAKSVMAWLQSVAQRLGEAGLPFDWTTPTGSRCRQAYHVRAVKEIDTLAGRLTLITEVGEGTLVPRKQALGASPNYVHSFDASHMVLTTVGASLEGITSFSMIHDSIGTHAGRTTLLARILREAFVEIYQTDWLQQLYQEIRTNAPHVAITEPPARGGFDIRQVLEAPFFFA